MPIGTAVHERTFALAGSLNYREWSGYYAVSAYEAHHEHEYNAIRNASALIDVSPLFKYLISGRDAVKLVDRVITRDAPKLAVGQVYYTPWCDEHGKVIDDGTVTRLDEDTLPLDRGGSEPALVHAERDRPRRRHRGHLRAGRRARAAGPDIGDAARRRGGRRHPQPEVLPHDARRRSPACRSRSRARDTPAISATRSGCRGIARSTVWDALMHRRPPVRHSSGRHARARRRARRSRPAAHRRRFQQQQEGADRVAEVLAVRDGARPSGAARRAAVRRPQRARRRASRAARRARSSASTIGWPAVEALYDSIGLRAADCRRPRRASPCRSTRTAARSAARRRRPGRRC